MKIIFVSDAIYPYNKGGKEKRLYEISTRLAKYGHEVHIFTMKWWSGEKIIKKDNIVLHGICHLKNIYTKNERRRSLWQAFYFGVKLFFPLLKENFDVLDADQIPYFHLFSCKLVCLLKRKKLIITWHEVWGKKKWYTYLGKAKGFFSNLIEILSVRLPDRIISVSNTTAEKLNKILNVEKEKITVIPNGINTDEINKASKANLKSDCIFAGRLVKHKNVDYLIKAIKIIKQKYKLDIGCVIIGDGPEKKSLENLSKELKLEKNIKFLGFLKTHAEVYSYFKASKVFVSPSTNEGFGITVLEANACGLPAIVVDHQDNAAKDLIVKSVNGYICRLSEKEIADKIQKIITTNNLKGTKQYCIEISKKYQWSNIAKEILDFYKED